MHTVALYCLNPLYASIAILILVTRYQREKK